MLTRLSSITVDKWIKQHFIICFIFYLNVLELYKTKRLINSLMEQETKKQEPLVQLLYSLFLGNIRTYHPTTALKAFFCSKGECMSEKRMFAKSIVLSDDFLDMPASARCLYFTLNMLADDDGFVNSPKSIMRQCMATDDDMRILLAKFYLIPFESGIVVIRHWRINNYLRCDRYTPTKFVEEKKRLVINESGAYEKIDSKELSGTIELKPAERVVQDVEPKKTVRKTRKTVPLEEREPKNDIEKVEKVYLENYRNLFNSGVLRSEKPIINWSASRKITKDCISRYGLDAIIEAVMNSSRNEFCVKKGYCLTTILSTGVLASLINGGHSPPNKKLSGKYDLSDLVS